MLVNMEDEKKVVDEERERDDGDPPRNNKKYFTIHPFNPDRLTGSIAILCETMIEWGLARGTPKHKSSSSSC